MSIEAVGQNGAVLGSDIYWNQLNSSSILGGLMQWTSGTEYYRTLQEAAARASTAIEEIYDDLQQNIGQICLVPSSPRSTLAKQVESLYNVCEMVGILNRHSRECQRILELRDLSASIDPFMESALQTAHQKIRKCTDFLPRECIDLAKEAATWGISSAAGTVASTTRAWRPAEVGCPTAGSVSMATPSPTAPGSSVGKYLPALDFLRLFCPVDGSTDG